MGIFKYFLLGVIEGITEFLPVSSTAHLILISNLFKIPQTDFHKFFEIFIQSGAILAVIFTYLRTIIENKKLLINLTISFTPTAILGLIFYKTIKNVFFESELIIISTLIGVGLIYLLIERFISKNFITLKHGLNNLSLFQAFLIGLFQALAIIPGVSRAGAVILGMLLLKFKREDAVIYSFLLAIPTIISAGIYDFYKIGFSTISLNLNNFFYLFIGFISSFVFALLTVKWFIRYLGAHNFVIFGFYRIVLGILILIYWFLTKSL